jgi:eukaryotic translation initiation factor 2C
VKSIIGDRKAVNCGTTQDPKWYAQELLRIVPYQLFTRPVPDCLTGSMVEQAAFDPAVAQRLIENEGLPQMGFSEVKDEKTSFVSQNILHPLFIPTST